MRASGATATGWRERYGAIVIVVALLLGGVAFVVVGWVRDGNEPAEALGVSLRRPRSLVVSIECADDLSARVVESAEEVRINRIDGDVHDGDACGSMMTIKLDRRLGSRDLVVQGDRWQRLPRECRNGYGQYGPVPDDDVTAACASALDASTGGG